MIFQRDELSKVVCNIRIPNGTSEEIATAIFIAKNDKAYLLTASHVVKNVKTNTYAVLSDASGNPIKVLLSDLLGGSTFTHHSTADLAKAEIQITNKNKTLLQNRCFPFNQIETNQINISKDLLLTSVGFPLGLGATGNKLSPLTFRTYVSAPLITLPRFDNKTPCDFIILELPSIGGYSGGPLFDLGYIISGAMKSRTGDTILHGIVHGTLSDPTGGNLQLLHLAAI